MGEGADRPRAGIVVTGSELLTGAISDANGPWLARRLADLGFEVAHVVSAGDRPDDLVRALEFLAGAGVALIVTSGGLGPTADDLTAEVVAGFAGVELEPDEAMRARIEEILADWGARTGFAGPALDEATRKQALVPRGATALAPVGTAPGLVVDRPGGPLVVVLPGPPRELQGMWPAAMAAPAVATMLATVPPANARLLRFFGLPESEIAATLREVPLDLSGVEVGTCLRRSELEVDLRPRPGAEAVAEQLAALIVERHARNLVSAVGATVDELVAQALLDRGLTVATGESCTGGLLAGRLVDRAGSSAYVAGGVVAYSNEAKTALLGVPAAMIAAHGAVSPEVARALADGARERFGADVGVGITGVAGPGGGTAAKPVGYVCFCVTTSDGTVLARDPQLRGSRADVRERSVDTAMHLILRAVAPRGA
ncbi:competence/damage-inducible protein A [Pseudonocardia sp.]|jgi:nicotinamide-nucleotide amidase|uniref:competence/damage-inducible protein A n=1 Tax=Pseudonocardia sp. TaxID=60912 RepID=UPI003D0B03A1